MKTQRFIYQTEFGKVTKLLQLFVNSSDDQKVENFS